MQEKAKCVIVVSPTEGGGPLSPDALRRVLKLLSESETLGDAFHGMAEKLEATPREAVAQSKEAPDFGGLAETLIELADKAEEYRDKLNGFIAEADELLETLSDLDAYWDDRGR